VLEKEIVLRKLSLQNKEIIIDRKKYIDELLKYKDKKTIKIITGVRRCGKSEIMKHFIKEILNKNVKNEQVIYINFEDRLVLDIDNGKELIDFVLKNKIDDVKYYLFFDEIQNVEG
jgi:predicted AAA+ superfamily ATPase